MIQLISNTGIGKRKENQDIILIEELVPESDLFLIVDGMGGYEHGKKAAEIISDSIYNYLRNCRAINSEKIDEAIIKANLAIKNFNTINKSKSGATIGGIIRSKNHSSIFWVGDVSIFLFKEKNIIFKSKSHSLVNDMIDAGNLVSAENLDKYKHIVTKSISGKREIILKSYMEFENNDFDKFVICSDGVTDTISIMNFIKNEIDEINNYLEEKAKDNYSYILVSETKS